MKSVSMKFKIIVLCSFFISIMVITSLFQSIQFNTLKESSKHLAEIDLPLVKRIGVIDMYHDGFQGLVYKSLHLANSTDEALKKSFQEEVLDAKKIMLGQIAEIKELKIESESTTLLNEAEPAVLKYIDFSEKIISTALSGKKTEAEGMIAEFDKQFEFLEEKLGAFGEFVEKSAQKNTSTAVARADNGSRNNLFLIIGSVIIGITASIYVVMNLMTGIRNAIENISVNVHDVQNSSQKMNYVSKKMSGYVNSQASGITESVAAMDEISAMIKNNDQSAKNANQLSEDAKDSAQNGKLTMNKMQEEVKSIAYSYEEIQATIEKSMEEIRNINQMIGEIASKTEVINDIVFQTKLLSFNASVEAARAGESGKGFAVVAEEVGNLAQMSGKASQEIASLLSESQEKVKGISNNINNNVSRIISSGQLRVKNGVAVSEECAREFDKIIGFIDNLNSSINEITVALNEQSSGVDEVNQSLRHIDQATTASTQMSVNLKDTAADLMKASHSLRSTIQDLRKDLGAEKSYEAAPLEVMMEESEKLAATA